MNKKISCDSKCIRKCKYMYSLVKTDYNCSSCNCYQSFAFVFCDFVFIAVAICDPVHDVETIHGLCSERGARWLSGIAMDSVARGLGFEPHDRRVVSLSKTL